MNAATRSAAIVPGPAAQPHGALTARVTLLGTGYLKVTEPGGIQLISPGGMAPSASAPIGVQSGQPPA